MRVFRSEEGFTLIELMIVIAIIAILAAIAVTQYQTYKRQAKAKELISVARNCALELVSECVAQNLDNSTTLNIGDYESCNYTSGDKIGEYLYISSVTNNGTPTCGTEFKIIAKGYVDNNTSACYKVECTVDTDLNVHCSTIKKASGCS